MGENLKTRVKLDEQELERAKEKLGELVELLEKANSLVRELASNCVHLEIDVQA